jgi:hypothetical protein
MERRQRPSFTDGHKPQAVDHVGSSGRSVWSLAKELGQWTPRRAQPCHRPDRAVLREEAELHVDSFGTIFF